MPPAFNFSDHPHRRRNALTGEWVLVSPRRAKRPWQGKVEDAPPDERLAYDPDCYLCPGNERAGGAKNPDYEETFAFDNDFSALRLNAPSPSPGTDESASDGNARKILFKAEAGKGICRVICYSPRHDLTLAKMPVEGIRRVVDLWADEYETLSKHEDIGYVQIFENKGQMMGCSNPHPHGQIWGQETVPGEPRKEAEQQASYYEKTGRTLLSDYVAAELEKDKRIVCQNEAFVALVPFWAVWPYKTIIISSRPAPSILDFTTGERSKLADLLQCLTTKYATFSLPPSPTPLGSTKRRPMESHTRGGISTCTSTRPSSGRRR